MKPKKLTPAERKIAVNKLIKIVRLNKKLEEKIINLPYMEHKEE